MNLLRAFAEPEPPSMVKTFEDERRGQRQWDEPSRGPISSRVLVLRRMGHKKEFCQHSDTKCTNCCGMGLAAVYKESQRASKIIERAGKRCGIEDEDEVSVGWGCGRCYKVCSNPKLRLLL